MVVFRRKVKPEKVVADVVEMGAPPETAQAIVDALVASGKSPREALDWLVHPERAYGHDWPMEIAGETMIMKAGSRFMIEKGNADEVLAAAREFADASADERLIAELFGGDIDGVRRMTGLDPARTTVTAEIARSLRATLGDDESVKLVGMTRLSGREERLVDRLLKGEQGAVRDELARGEIDPRALLRDGELIFTGW